MNFTTGQAKGLVVGATCAAAILSSADNLANGKVPTVRNAVGAVVVASVLYAAADWQPELAGSLALVLLLGAILTNGVRVANIVTTATAKK